MDSRTSDKGNFFPRSVLAAALVLFAVACPLSKSATYFPLFASAAFALYYWAKAGERFLPLNSLRWLFGIWMLTILWQYVTLIANHSDVSPVPVLRALNFLPVFALAGLPCNREWKENTAKNALFVLLSVTAVTVILGLYQKGSGITYPLPVQPFADGKLVGFFGYHIHAGGFLSVVGILTLCLILFWETPARTKIVLAVLLSIFAAGVLFSMSRTYYLSSLVMLPVIFIRKGWRHAVAGTALLVVLIAVALSFSPAIKDRSLSIIDVNRNISNVERIYLWNVARDIICDHPVTGVGFRQWGNRLPDYAGKYAAEWKFSPAALHHAHNVYLNTASETGLVGLALFIVFWFGLLYLMFSRVGKLPPRSFGLALTLGASYGLINFLVGGLFEENFGNLLNMFLIAFLVSLSFFVNIDLTEGGGKTL